MTITLDRPASSAARTRPAVPRTRAAATAPAVPRFPATPVVRVLPAPRSEPPFDDELPGVPPLPAWPELPLLWREPGTRAETPGTPATREPVRRTGPGRPVPRQPSEAEQAAVRFLKGYAEVLDGFRPLRHLVTLIAPEAVDAVVAHVVEPRLPGRLGPVRGGAGTGATGAPVPARGRPPARAQVERRHYVVNEPLDGVAEVSAVLGRGTERWALALRLELRASGWLCTVLEVI